MRQTTLQRVNNLADPVWFRLSVLWLLLSITSSCGGLNPFSSKSEVAGGEPPRAPTVIPPVPVTGSYLTSILMDEDLKPMPQAEVQADAGQFTIRTDDAGRFALPVGLVKDDAVDVDVIANNQTLFLTIHMPLDLADSVRNTDSAAGVALERGLGILIPGYKTQAMGTPVNQNAPVSAPTQRIAAVTLSLPAAVVQSPNTGTPVIGFTVTSHKNLDVITAGFELSGSCIPGQFINLSGDLFQSSGDTKQCNGSGSSGRFVFSGVTLSAGDGLKKLTITQVEKLATNESSTFSSRSVSRLLILNKVSPPTVPKLDTSNVTGLRATLTGFCDTSAVAHTAVTSVGAVNLVECVNGVLRVVVHLPASSGSERFSVTVTSSRTVGGTSTSGPLSFTRSEFKCPPGYVGVPASGITGLGNAVASNTHPGWWLNTNQDFCVMKYPAKRKEESSLSRVYANSEPAGLPWVGLVRGADETTPDSAMKACNDIPAGSSILGLLLFPIGDYRLMSNTQWQTVARNVESVAANWSGNAVGAGVLARGHSDGEPNSLLENSNDTNPYFGTGNSSNAAWNKLGATPPPGSEQLRTRILSNGEIVWDFGGNVHQFVSDDVASLGLNPRLQSGPLEFNDATNFPINSVNRLILGPAVVHALTGSVIGGDAGAIARGGSWQSPSVAGLYSGSLSMNSTATAADRGFRCAYKPN